jgi:anti-sigma factor RsiW
MMPEQKINCPYNDESDIDARYLAGALSATESEAFEEHYFSCDRCFAAVQRGNEIRAALSLPASADTIESPPLVIPLVHPRRRFSAWQPALAAAAAVILILGVRQLNAPRRSASTVPPISGSDAARGAAPSLALSSHATSAVLVVAWSPPSAARSYRVRLLATDGSLLFEREIADTSIMLSRDLLRGAKSPVYWEVQALNALRSVVAISPVVPAQTSPSPP